jgi:WD40 repeat protein
VRIEATLKISIQVEVPKDKWIVDVLINNLDEIYAVADTKIMVIDPNSGNTSTLKCHVKRPITCICYHELQNYTFVGCADGSGIKILRYICFKLTYIFLVKIFNISNALVQEFVSHTQPVVSIVLFPKGNIFLSCSIDMTVRMYSLKTFKEVYW